jgi:hypothetical protein
MEDVRFEFVRLGVKFVTLIMLHCARSRLDRQSNRGVEDAIRCKL